MFNPRTIIHKTIDTESSTESILSLMNSNKNLCSMLSQSVEEVSIINFSIQDSRSNGYTPEASELPQAAENKAAAPEQKILSRILNEIIKRIL